MSNIRLFIDEDVYGAVTIALRAAGVDVTSTPETGRISESDVSQLEWAIQEQRAIVTFNVGDFVELHTNWLTAGQHHCGIIVSSQRPIGDVIARLLNLVGSLDENAMRDRLEFLSDW
ncbi:DUF5615 family PIN-like protein [Aeoliella sp.]|uniref:DUF5615 family PIN-like protein n=1 Tax=Aeoliella sp. TaxID=2795800 RepID=UPI003CCC21CC